MRTKIDDNAKEIAAISLMQSMLEDYSNIHQIAYEKVLDEFSKSKTYLLLFDFTTELWSVGQNYLLEIYEGEVNSNVNDTMNECSARIISNIMIEKYAKKHNISINLAMKKFLSSNIYKALFDYETKISEKGPDYLLDLFEKELQGK